jgi:hypothetical protein
LFRYPYFAHFHLTPLVVALFLPLLTLHQPTQYRRKLLTRGIRFWEIQDRIEYDLYEELDPGPAFHLFYIAYNCTADQNWGRSIAFIDQDEKPEQGPRLNFVLTNTGSLVGNPWHFVIPDIWNSISLFGIKIPYGYPWPTGFNVMTAGFSANGKMYVFCTTNYFNTRDHPLAGVPDNWDVMGRSVLTWSDQFNCTVSGSGPFHYLYDMSDVIQGGKFINLSAVVVNNADIPGLPDTAVAGAKGLLLWGTGVYRLSNPYLAYVPLTDVETKSNLRYFAGTEPNSYRPKWSTEESVAKELFNDQPQVGEICVTWNQFLGVWLMLYNADNPGGINFRVAKKPWGPWSPTAWLDNGYCHFMHGYSHYVDKDHPDQNVPCDSVSDPGIEKTGWGGAYGPFIISRYTRGDSNHSTIYFVMSTWNLYNTVLMKSTLELEPI